MAGRPRKVVDVSTGKIGKQARLNRRIQEEEIKVSRNALEDGAPIWLSETAAAEYNRVVAEAKTIGLFDNLDLAILAIYADYFSLYVEASKKARECGMVIEVGDKEIPTAFIAIMDKAATQILKCSTKLGLAVTDRLKLIVPTKEEKKKNKFVEFLNNG